MEEIVSIAFMSPEVPAGIAEAIRYHISTLPITLTNGTDENLCMSYLLDALGSIHNAVVIPGEALILRCEAFREIAP